MRRLLIAAHATMAPLCAQNYVIQNATIMTVTKGTIKGSIVVKDGKIAEVGERVMVPQGAVVVDASGQYVIPGIIDCHSHIAADGGINEGSVSVSSMVGIKDFNETKVYKAAWDPYDAKVARGEHPIPPRKDLKLEALKEVLEGKRYVHVHCYRADEILMILRVADDYGFKIRTLQHVLEGYKVAKEIAAHGAGASTFSDWWSYKVEAYDAIPFNAAIMTRKGVIVSLNSDSAELMRHLNDEAAKTMKYGGLDETEALSLITINPAKQLMLDKRVGSIEPGKDADITIFDKHPLSNFAKVQKVFIDGQLYFDRDNDLAERPAREIDKKKLTDKDKEQQRRTAPGAQRRPAA